MKPSTPNIFGISKKRGIWLRCFLEVCAVIVLVATPYVSWPQFVGYPCNGTKAECAAKFDQYCRTTEDRGPNLLVPRKTRIWGVLIDPTGAEFAHPEPGLTVEVRDLKASTVIASGQVSQMGTFEVGEVAPGSYRLIVVLMIDGKRTRFRNWKQPDNLACPESGECTLAALLRPGGTDNVIDFCPPE